KRYPRMKKQQRRSVDSASRQTMLLLARRMIERRKPNPFQSACRGPVHRALYVRSSSSEHTTKRPVIKPPDSVPIMFSFLIEASLPRRVRPVENVIVLGRLYEVMKPG